MSDAKPTSSIAILGAGDVGATIAYSLIMNPVAGDILLVDPKEEVRDAQVIPTPRTTAVSNFASTFDPPSL